jgi:hypothetical protein
MKMAKNLNAETPKVKKPVATALRGRLSEG